MIDHTAATSAPLPSTTNDAAIACATARRDADDAHRRGGVIDHTAPRWRQRVARGQRATASLLIGCAVALLSTSARAHDVGLEVSGAYTSPSSVNPRSGGVGVSASGAYDVSDAFSLFALAGYLRDLPTKTQTSSSKGGDIFRFSLGAQWLPKPNWMFMLALSGSPPAAQTNSTREVVTDPRNGESRAVDVTIDSSSYSLGGMLVAGWMTGGFSNFESALDVSAGLNRYDIFQQVRLGDGAASDFVRRVCARRPDVDACRLVEGVSTPLWQGRFAATYTATLFLDTDVSLEGAVYAYDTDPADVGYFSPVIAGRQDFGVGVPVSPMLFSLRPQVLRRFKRVTLRFNYQFGLFSSGLGAMHALTGKLTWKVAGGLRLTLTVVGQLDVDGTSKYLGAGVSGVLGAMYVF